MPSCRAAIVALAALCAACATSPAHIVLPTSLVNLDELSLVDARAIEDSDHRDPFVGKHIAQCRLVEKLGGEIAGKDIVVKKFDISLTTYTKRFHSSPSYTPSSGNLGADLAGHLLAGLILAGIEQARATQTASCTVELDVDGQNIVGWASEEIGLTADKGQVLQSVPVKAIDDAIEEFRRKIVVAGKPKSE